MRTPAPTPRLDFAAMEPSDLDFMARLLGDPRAMTYYPRPYTREEVAAWIEWNEGLCRERGFGLWLLILRETGQPVGDCGLTIQEVEGAEAVELGYHVHPDFQRRGLATEAAMAVRAYARDELGLDRLVALVHPANEPSMRVAEAVGLTLAGESERPSGTTLLVFAGDVSAPLPTRHKAADHGSSGDPLTMAGSFGTAVGAAMLGFEQALRSGPPAQILAGEHMPERGGFGQDDGLVIEFPEDPGTATVDPRPADEAR
jgi:RimJ/RimL family protein N-acetyltransferase